MSDDQAPAEPSAPEYLPLTVLMGRVLADVPAVGKNSQAPANMGGYAFRGIEDVLAAIKPAMARHGVFCIPDVIERLPTERPLGSGKVMFVVDLFIRWTFHGPAGDTLTSTCWGQGTDMGDKATQKAMTSAFKSMLMQTFVIGDSASDAEAHSVPETQHIPPPKTDGWDSAEQEAEAHKDIRHRLAQLPEDHPVRIAGRVLREKHGWPVAMERLKELRELLEEAENAQEAAQHPPAPVPPSTTETPAPAPESGQSADPEPMPWDNMPTPPPVPEPGSAVAGVVEALSPSELSEALLSRGLGVSGNTKVRQGRLIKALESDADPPVTPAT